MKVYKLFLAWYIFGATCVEALGFLQLVRDALQTIGLGTPSPSPVCDGEMLDGECIPIDTCVNGEKATGECICLDDRVRKD